MALPPSFVKVARPSEIAEATAQYFELFIDGALRMENYAVDEQPDGTLLLLVDLDKVDDVMAKKFDLLARNKLTQKYIQQGWVKMQISDAHGLTAIMTKPAPPVLRQPFNQG